MLDSKILLGIIFLICSILSDYQTNALRCYQCIQGSNYFCDEGDMYPVTCPSDAIKCGIAYATKDSVKYEWRGCVNSTEDTNITANLGTFGNQLLSSKINASSYETCAADLCNSPLKCYFCTAGVSNICGINDTGVTNCNLKHSSCAKITFSDDQVWKGCLTSDQVSNYGDQSTLLLKLNSDFGVSNLTASSPTGFYSCSTNMCNAGRIAASLGIVTSLAPLLLSLVLLWINL